jgi:uncharacterized DUF497 family protein
MGSSQSESKSKKAPRFFQGSRYCIRDPMSITFYDPDHSEAEDRFMIIGFSTIGRLLMVALTERGDQIRIISARELTRVERKAY